MPTNNKNHKDAIKQYVEDIRPLVRIDQREEAEWRLRKIVEHSKDLVRANQVTPGEHASVTSDRDRLKRENNELYEALDKAGKEKEGIAAELDKRTADLDTAAEAVRSLVGDQVRWLSTTIISHLANL